MSASHSADGGPAQPPTAARSGHQSGAVIAEPVRESSHTIKHQRKRRHRPPEARTRPAGGTMANNACMAVRVPKSGRMLSQLVECGAKETHRHAREAGQLQQAREVFEIAAKAARRLTVVDAELDAMGESWRRGEWLGSGAKGWHGDPTSGQAGYRMRRSKALEQEREALKATIEDARTLANGVGELLGKGYEDALLYRYVENKPWQQVADALGVCLKTAHNRANTALDTVDALGRARVLAGRGVAEDG